MWRSKVNMLTRFSSPSDSDTKYWYGLDIIRFIVTPPIVYFHAYEMLFYEDIIPFKTGIFVSISRFLIISVFIIISLISFLYGLKKVSNKRRKKLIILLPLGFIVLLFTQGDEPFKDLYTDWDIFCFLAVSILSLYGLEKFKKLITPAAVIGFILLCVPLWEWFPSEDSYLKNILVGNCAANAPGNAFPIFPWIGLIWFCYGLGVWTRKGSINYLSKWTKVESFIWLALFIVAFPQWGAYYSAPLGPGFFCFMLRQTPFIFWSHFIVILFLMRLSLVSTVNNFLAQLKICHWLRQLMWMRLFGICYVTHFIFIGLYYLFIPTRFNEIYCLTGAIQAFVLTEISVRSVVYMSQKIFQKKEAATHK